MTKRRAESVLESSSKTDRPVKRVGKPIAAPTNKVIKSAEFVTDSDSDGESSMRVAQVVATRDLGSQAITGNAGAVAARSTDSGSVLTMKPKGTAYKLKETVNLTVPELEPIVTHVKLSNVTIIDETRKGTRTLRCEDQETFNKGAFSNIERQSVEDAINKYLDTFGIPRSDLAYLTAPKAKTTLGTNPYLPAHKDFFKTVHHYAKINRSVKQIYWFIRIAYNEIRPQIGASRQKRTQWTKEEDDQLLKLIDIKGYGNWVEIDKVLGRIGSKDRYKNLGYRKVGDWTEEEDASLIKHGKEIMVREGISDPLKFNSYTELTIKLGNRIYADVYKRWNTLGPKLNLEKKSYELNDLKTLLKRMAKKFKHATDESEVHWKSILKSSDTISYFELQKRWKAIRRELSKRHDLSKVTFKEAIKLAKDNIEDIYKVLKQDTAESAISDSQ